MTVFIQGSCLKHTPVKDYTENNVNTVSEEGFPKSLCVYRIGFLMQCDFLCLAPEGHHTAEATVQQYIYIFCNVCIVWGKAVLLAGSKAGDEMSY